MLYCWERRDMGNAAACYCDRLIGIGVTVANVEDVS